MFTSAGHILIACGDIVNERAFALALDFGAPGCVVTTDRGLLSMHLTAPEKQLPQMVVIAIPKTSLAYNHLKRIAWENGSQILALSEVDEEEKGEVWKAGSHL